MILIKLQFPFLSISVGSMPVLLTLSAAVLFLLTLVLVFIEFGEKSCCGQYTFLTFFNLFFIAPVVVWSAMVIFPLGIPTDELTSPGELIKTSM